MAERPGPEWHTRAEICRFFGLKEDSRRFDRKLLKLLPKSAIKSGGGRGKPCWYNTRVLLDRWRDDAIEHAGGSTSADGATKMNEYRERLRELEVRERELRVERAERQVLPAIAVEMCFAVIARIMRDLGARLKRLGRDPFAAHQRALDEIKEEAKNLFEEE